MKRVICLLIALIMAILPIGYDATYCTKTSRISAAEIATELLDNINGLREEKGLKPVEISDHLNELSAIRVKELPEKWSHTRPDGTKWQTVFEKKYDNAWKGENLAYCIGVLSGDVAPAMFDNLCESKEHYENMLYKDFRYVGIAVYKKGNTYYSAMEFCSKK